ncbi:MAG: BamA/TamA family outer membrane protein [Thermoanaerobaculia bacterium]
MRFRRGFLLAGALSWSALSLPYAAAAQSVAPAVAQPTAPVPIVRAIEIRSDAQVNLAEVRELLSIAVGQPLDESRTRRTLRSLRYSGLASEVAIYERPAASDVAGGEKTPLAAVPGAAVGEGVVAIVALWTDVQVTAVDAVGDLGLRKSRLLQELPQRSGQPLREDRLLRGVYRLQDVLIGEGFLQAQVRLEVATAASPATGATGAAGASGASGASATTAAAESLASPPASTAQVTYRIAAGPRTRIRKVTFAGASPQFRDAELLKATPSPPGAPFKKKSASESVERLQSWLFARSYREATVELKAPVLDSATASADLAFDIHLGPRIDFEVQGATLRELKKNDLVPFLGDSGYDEALVLQSIDQIRRYFQEKGHYRVAVTKTETREADRVRLLFEVVPGPRFTLDELSFTGNASYDSDRLRRLMSTSPRRFLLPRSGRLVDEELSADLSNLRSFYLLEGFDHSQVGPARIDERGDRLEVVVPIVEGRRRIVTELTLEDMTPLDAAKVREALPLKSGGPFHRLLLERSADTVRALLEDKGYGAAIVSSDVVWSPDDLQAKVTLRAFAGEQWVVDRTLLRGLRKTKPKIVRRFLGIQPGDPVRRTAILDLQRQLYGLGIFSRVDVRVAPGSEGGEARELLVDLEEGRSRSISTGIGYDSETGARALLRLSQGNLFGRASSISLDLLGSRAEQHFRLIYRQPYIGPFRAELLGSIYDEHEDRPDFSVDRRGGQLVLGREFGHWSLQTIGSFRLVELDPGPEDVEIPRDSLNARVASVTPTASYDRRDDPIDPTRGWNSTLQLEYAFPLLSADAHFLKLFSQATGYLPLGRFGVLAASARGGAIEPLSAGLSPRDALQSSVPAAELFYAGGRTTHRAYRRDELGIRGDTLDVASSDGKPFPKGGGGLALLNLELRFPVAGPVGGTLFLDGGNVWSDYRDVNLDEFKWGAGLGVRYLSPVGPLRLEIGWKLHRESFEDPFVWFISLGNPF